MTLQPRELIQEINEDAILYTEELDHCIIGFTSRSVVYSFDKILTHFSKEMNETDALEYVLFNLVDAYLGEHSPIIIREI